MPQASPKWLSRCALGCNAAFVPVRLGAGYIEPDPMQARYALALLLCASIFKMVWVYKEHHLKRIA
jgi:hypothetical protein